MPFVFRAPAWGVESAGALESMQISQVIALVASRERQTDVITPFRQGTAVKIAAVMGQYATVAAELGTLPRVMALNWALRQYLTAGRRGLYAKAVHGPHLEGSVTSFGAGDLKCNKLVADAYAAGAGCGLSTGDSWYDEGTGTGWPAKRDGASLWPPVANDLANPTKNLRSLTNARELRAAGEEKAQPELGDLICFPAEMGSGHVGLYLGKNLIVSAKETGIEIHPLEYEQAQHGNIARIRKFTGTGK